MAKILTQVRSDRGLPTTHWYYIEKNLRVAPWSAPKHTAAAVMDDSIVRNPDFEAPISLARDCLGTEQIEKLDSWDVLHLHNVNGVLDLAHLAERYPSKKIVWTLHDMNPMTGACHYSLGCKGHLTNCSSCPAVRVAFQPQVRFSLSRKTMAINGLTDLTVVAPSQWLADRARESSALRNVPVRVIPNPINPLFCASLGYKAQTSKYTFCVIAQNLSDPIKNVGAAVRNFLELKKSNAHISLALVGNNGDSFSTDGVIALGALSAPGIVETLSNSTAVIVPSLAENSPLVIAEAAARGATCIVSNAGGMPDMVASLGAGYVFSSDAELQEAMSAVMLREDPGAPAAREKLSGRAIALFSPMTIGRQYEDLYSN